MKAYMAFLASAGPQEGAILVVDNNIRDAKRLAWKRCPFDFVEYIDLRLKIIDKSVLALANQEKLQAGIPHVIDSPIGCQHCECWGAGITKDNLCSNCNEYPGDELIRAMNSYVA